MSGVAGEQCKTCYGEGNVPTDEGPLPCSDCAGAGTLPHHDTLVEWRLRSIERAHATRDEGVATDIKWLAFELRRAREALTGLLALTDEVEETDDVQSVPARMRFIANRALGLYDVTSAEAQAPAGARGDRRGKEDR